MYKDRTPCVGVRLNGLDGSGRAIVPPTSGLVTGSPEHAISHKPAPWQGFPLLHTVQTICSAGIC